MRRRMKNKVIFVIVGTALLLLIALWKFVPMPLDVIMLADVSQYEPFPKRVIQVKDFDSCEKIINGDSDAIILGKEIGGKSDFEVKSPQSYYYNISRGCKSFAMDRGYILNYLTNEEKYFPLAYSIIFYTSFEQMENLLRAIYRPHNFYCLHLDKLAAPVMHKALKALSDCFENVILPAENIDVIPGRMSVLEPEIVCMKELLKHRKWRYFINLTGQEVPLKTNRQIVQILKAFRGHNDVKTNLLNEDFRRRWARVGPPPHNLTLYKGEVHVSLCRAFVEFIMKDPRVQDLLGYLQHTRHPAEAFFTTVNNNPSLEAPGGFKGTYEEALAKPWMTRFKLWEWDNNTVCHGTYDAGRCILGVGDLPQLTRAPHLFANKFKWNHEPLGLRCMHEWAYNQTRDEYHSVGAGRFNVSSYHAIHDRTRHRHVARDFR